MSLLGLLFGRKEISTVTEADIDARIKRAEGSVPLPAFVLDSTETPEEPVKTSISCLPGDIVVGSQIYDANGYVPADEWAQLGREEEAYLASLPPMKRDPGTGRPVRD